MHDDDDDGGDDSDDDYNDNDFSVEYNSESKHDTSSAVDLTEFCWC